MLVSIQILCSFVSLESFDKFLQENDELVHFVSECCLNDSLLVFANLQALHLIIFSFLLPLYGILIVLNIIDYLVKLRLRFLELILLLLNVLQPLIINLQLILDYIDLGKEFRHFLVNNALALLLQSSHIIHVFVFQMLNIQEVERS